MSVPSRGMMASLSLNGTPIALLTDIAFDWSKAFTEFAQMGTEVVTSVMQGVRKYKGSFRRAFVNWDFVNGFIGNTVYLGTLTPITGKTAYGSLIITGGSLNNMKMEETAAIVEEGSFVMYSLTFG